MERVYDGDSKAWLERGWQAERRIQAKERQLAALKDRLSSIGASRPAGEREAEWTRAAEALEGERDGIEREIAALSGVREEIRAVIEGVDAQVLRELLEYRYLCYMTWAEIARAIGYAERYAYKLHNRALAQVDMVRRAGRAAK